VAASRGHAQAVVAGLAPQDDISSLGLPPDAAWFPVRFQSTDLPFPVVGMSDVMPYPSTRWRDLTSVLLAQWRGVFREAIQSALETFRPNLILTHHLWLLSALVRELAPDVPAVVFCHGTGLRQLELAPQLAPLAVEGCRGLPRVLALTEQQQDAIVQRYGIPAGRITVTGGAYDDRVFHPHYLHPQDGLLRVVYAGKLSRAKGLLPLLDAWDTLPATLAPCELTLAGSAQGEEAEAIRRRAEHCRMPVRLPGALPQSALAALFAASDVFVLPSYYEGLPLVLLEALACGLRAVCTNLPGVRDWCGCCVSDRVGWVPLPLLCGVDTPEPCEVPAFTKRLTAALTGQLAAARRTGRPNIEPIRPLLAAHTWEALFVRVEEAL